MSKNKKVMSIAIKPELHEELKKFSKRKGISASTYIGNLIEQAVKINIDDDPVIIGKPMDEEVSPVILKIPSVLKTNPEKFKQWMDSHAASIVNAMTKQVNTVMTEDPLPDQG